MTKYSENIKEWLIDTLSGHKTRENYFKKHKPEWYSDMQKYKIENNLEIKSFHQLLYHYLNDVKYIPSCENKRKLKFWCWQNGYSKYCENHRECPICNKKHQEDIHNKVKEKYGVDNVGQVKEYNEKRKKTTKERWGDECTWRCEKIIEKKNKTVKEKYGVDNVRQLENVKEKIRNTCLKKYGVDSYSKTKDFLDKHKKTVIKNYGVDHQWKSKQIRENIKNTCLKKYGVDCISKVKEFHDKAKQTNLKKYGHKNPQNSEIVKEKCRKKYGTEYPMQNTEIFEKSMHKCFAKKTIMLPSGKMEYVQGWEGPTILKLIENGIKEENIIISDKDIEDKIGKIFYNKNRYFPDFLIKENKSYIICEVKSEYTYKTSLKNQILYKKMCACKNLGHIFNILIVDKQGNILKKIDKLEQII